VFLVFFSAAFFCALISVSVCCFFAGRFSLHARWRRAQARILFSAASAAYAAPHRFSAINSSVRTSLALRDIFINQHDSTSFARARVNRRCKHDIALHAAQRGRGTRLRP